LVALLQAAPAQAQATRTWVSGVGDDANPCSRTAPCKTFAGAISKTAAAGEISVLDPGGFGGVTITKSITLNGDGTLAGILNSGGVNGIIINALSTDKVVIHNLSINGGGTGLNGIRILSAGSVSVENTTIIGDTSRGISDERTTGGKLSVIDSAVRNVGAGGIVVIPNVGNPQISVNIDNVRIHNATTSAVAILNAAKGMISRSAISGSGTGVESTGAGAEATVDSTTISGNSIGLQQGSGGVLRIGNSSVSLNGTGVSGSVLSFTNSRINGNGGGGTITAIGGPVEATGLQ
jgi:hypothetical protein